MSYTIVVTMKDGSTKVAACMFIDQKNIEVNAALRRPDAINIKVMYNSENSERPTYITEEWNLKKPFLGIFGSTQWIKTEY